MHSAALGATSRNMCDDPNCQMGCHMSTKCQNCPVCQTIAKPQKQTKKQKITKQIVVEEPSEQFHCEAFVHEATYLWKKEAERLQAEKQEKELYLKKMGQQRKFIPPSVPINTANETTEQTTDCDKSENPPPSPDASIRYQKFMRKTYKELIENEKALIRQICRSQALNKKMEQLGIALPFFPILQKSDGEELGEKWYSDGLRTLSSRREEILEKRKKIEKRSGPKIKEEIEPDQPPQRQDQKPKVPGEAEKLNKLDKFEESSSFLQDDKFYSQKSKSSVKNIQNCPRHKKLLDKLVETPKYIDKSLQNDELCKNPKREKRGFEKSPEETNEVNNRKTNANDTNTDSVHSKNIQEIPQKNRPRHQKLLDNILEKPKDTDKPLQNSETYKHSKKEERVSKKLSEKVFECKNLKVHEINAKEDSVHSKFDRNLNDDPESCYEDVLICSNEVAKEPERKNCDPEETVHKDESARPKPDMDKNDKSLKINSIDTPKEPPPIRNQADMDQLCLQFRKYLQSTFVDPLCEDIKSQQKQLETVANKAMQQIATISVIVKNFYDENQKGCQSF